MPKNGNGNELRTRFGHKNQMLNRVVVSPARATVIDY